MSDKERKVRTGGGPGQRRGRTATDRARDRAINRAIARAGDQSGPIIVRVGAMEKPSIARNSASRAKYIVTQQKTATKAEDPTNTAMGQALTAAGLNVTSKSPCVSQPADQKDELRTTKPERGRREGAKTKQNERPKKKAKQSAKLGPRQKPSSNAAEIEAEKLANRQKRFLAELRKKAAVMQGALTPAELRWEQRQQEIARLVENIRGASFETLATAWKKHVSLAGYIEETGRNSDRLLAYTNLIAAIEREWGRRAKMKFNSDEYFDWPSTLAAKSRKGIAEINWAADGFLSYLGYHVGESSDLTERERRAILRRTFKMILPPLESPEYVKSWGSPSSPPRLKKMAHSLASFARSAKRRGVGSFATAISQWEADLAMLREEFYVAKFGFGWPTA